MKYKLVGEDEDLFHVQHEDGSTFSIAKSAVGPAVHEKIKALKPVKMADGGVAEKSLWEAPEDRRYEFEDLGKGIQDIRTSVSDWIDKGLAANDTPLPEAQTPPIGTPVEDYAAQSTPTTVESVDASEPTPAPTQPAEPPAPARSPATTPEQQEFNPMAVQLAAQEKGLQKQQDINTQLNKSQQSGYLEMGKNQKELKEARAENTSHFEPIINNLQTRGNVLFQGIMESKIDPNRIWRDTGTANKIGAAIMVGLSGIGAGLSGKSNMAMDVIQKTIDRDIESQRAELGKQETLFSENLRQLGDVRAAKAATESQLLASAQAQGNMIATKMGSADAAARIQLANQEISMKREELHQQAALYSAMAKGGADTTDKLISYLRVKNPQMAKEMESRYVPRVGLAAVPIPEKIREDLGARQSLQEEVQHLRKWAQQHSGSLNPEEMAYGKALANTVQDSYRRANGQGVFKESEAEFVKGVVADDPTAFWNKVRVDPKYKALEESNLMALNGLKKTYGLPTATANPEAGLSDEQKQWVVWARKNTNDPRSAVLLKKLGIQ